MRRLVLVCACCIACAKPEPVQDPLDYLRVGVDPHAEAEAVMADLRRHGYQIGRRIEERAYVAFDAARGPESTVRVVTVRGPSLSLQVPDIRAPLRTEVSLGPDPRPDFDRDGQRDIVVAIRELDRTCLAWAQVDSDGFVSEVFRAKAEWGNAPCVLEIDLTWPRVLLEVSVPDSPAPGARVRFSAKAMARDWVVDDSPAASTRWKREIEQREAALEVAEARGDTFAVSRLGAELAWIETLRATETEADAGVPDGGAVLEPPGDGQEAR